jgi:hypothetical protein
MSDAKYHLWDAFTAAHRIREVGVGQIQGSQMAQMRGTGQGGSAGIGEASLAANAIAPQIEVRQLRQPHRSCQRLHSGISKLVEAQIEYAQTRPAGGGRQRITAEQFTDPRTRRRTRSHGACAAIRSWTDCTPARLTSLR